MRELQHILDPRYRYFDKSTTYNNSSVSNVVSDSSAVHTSGVPQFHEIPTDVAMMPSFGYEGQSGAESDRMLNANPWAEPVQMPKTNKQLSESASKSVPKKASVGTVGVVMIDIRGFYKEFMQLGNKHGIIENKVGDPFIESTASPSSFFSSGSSFAAIPVTDQHNQDSCADKHELVGFSPPASPSIDKKAKPSVLNSSDDIGRVNPGTNPKAVIAEIDPSALMTMLQQEISEEINKSISSAMKEKSEGSSSSESKNKQSGPKTSSNNQALQKGNGGKSKSFGGVPVGSKSTLKQKASSSAPKNDGGKTSSQIYKSPAKKVLPPPHRPVMKKRDSSGTKETVKPKSTKVNESHVAAEDEENMMIPWLTEDESSIRGGAGKNNVNAKEPLETAETRKNPYTLPVRHDADMNEIAEELNNEYLGTAGSVGTCDSQEFSQ